MQSNRQDALRLSIALVLILSALAGFYYMAEQSLLIRVIGLIAVLGVAIAIAMTTERGRSTWGFFQDARMEVRKVVWPGRSETTQTTMLVLAMVIVMALLLWMFDSVLSLAVRWLAGLGA